MKISGWYCVIWWENSEFCGLGILIIHIDAGFLAILPQISILP